MWQLICGNGIAKILGRNLIVILAMDWRGGNVAMKLPKMRGNFFFVAAKFRNWRKEDLG